MLQQRKINELQKDAETKPAKQEAVKTSSQSAALSLDIEHETSVTILLYING